MNSQVIKEILTFHHLFVGKLNKERGRGQGRVANVPRQNGKVRSFSAPEMNELSLNHLC